MASPDREINELNLRYLKIARDAAGDIDVLKERFNAGQHVFIPKCPRPRSQTLGTYEEAIISAKHIKSRWCSFFSVHEYIDDPEPCDETVAILLESALQIKENQRPDSGTSAKKPGNRERAIHKLINLPALRTAFESFSGNTPFNHCVCDGFFRSEIVHALEQDFPPYEDTIWHEYDNAVEKKKSTNIWNFFPPTTYRIFSVLTSPEFLRVIAELTGIVPLFADPGLNSGGWHILKKGGKLNPHLDFNIHPKSGLQRKLNLVVFLPLEWRSEWGGELGFWEADQAKSAPGRLLKTIPPQFNRAVFFDTTQQSWHGLSSPVQCPEGVFRKSLSVCYLTDPPPETDHRGKAHFAPTQEQEGDRAVAELIQKRASVSTASSVYKP